MTLLRRHFGKLLALCLSSLLELLALRDNQLLLRLRELPAADCLAQSISHLRLHGILTFGRNLIKDRLDILFLKIKPLGYF